MISAWLVAAPAAVLPAALFFDDFSDADAAALALAGWQVRSAAGHPGVPGARWASGGVSLVDDPNRPGNRLLQLQARTDGTPAGTEQAQICQRRKFLWGTYAARVHLADEPASGADGDPVIQAFYAVSPLRHAFDPQFSEVDWEYLPNGGWGSPATRLYGISWQTVQVEPWQAHNSAHERPGSLQGWHTLSMQVRPDAVRMFVDGRLHGRHGGRNVPVVPMALAFNLWFSPGGLLPASAVPRTWRMQVDWVFHAAGEVLTARQVRQAVQQLRHGGIARMDTVPEAQPPLESRCDF